MTKFLSSLFLCAFLAVPAGCQTVPSSDNNSLENSYPTLFPEQESLSPKEIMARAHEAAGGETWRRPQSLAMDGYAVFYQEGQTVKHERHRMWRVYDASKSDAHTVDGKVRILSEQDGKAIIDLSYNGETTYTTEGAQPKSESDKQWSSNFGFGVVRHALDEGYALERLPDDLIDGQAAYMIRVIDAADGITQFGVSQTDYSILKVSFDTPRGWHERIYSHFYSNPNESWVQPGRVRLYYNGVKANEVIWTKYVINKDSPDCLFVLPQAAECQTE